MSPIPETGPLVNISVSISSQTTRKGSMFKIPDLSLKATLGVDEELKGTDGDVQKTQQNRTKELMF